MSAKNAKSGSDGPYAEIKRTGPAQWQMQFVPEAIGSVAPSAAMAFDAALLLPRFGLIEIHLIQLSASDSKRIARLVAARFDYQLFMQTMLAVKQFQQTLAADVAGSNLLRPIVDELANAVKESVIDDLTPHYLFDATHMQFYTFGDRGGILFFQTKSESQKFVALNGPGDNKRIDLEVHLAATMSTAALAMLVSSWIEIFNSLQEKAAK